MMTIDYAERTALLPVGGTRTGKPLSSFGSFTVHETGNQDPGADAAMHKRYWSPGGDGRNVTSIHFVTDSDTSLQLIPINERAVHAGDATGNMTSVGGEICVNSREGFWEACERMTVIAARVLFAHGKGVIDGVTLRKHGSWPGTTHKACPAHLNRGDWGITWAQFVAMVATEHAALHAPVQHHQYFRVRYPWGAQVREAKDVDANPALGGLRLRQGETFAGEIVQGVPWSGDARWVHLVDQRGFVHMSAVEAV